MIVAGLRLVYPDTTMNRRSQDPDLLLLDDETQARLDHFAANSGLTPGQAAASLLRELLWDREFWREACKTIH